MESYCYDRARNRLSLLGVTHGLNYLVLRESARLTGTRLVRTGYLLTGPDSNCLCRAAGLQHNESVEHIFRKRVGADGRFVHGESDKHKLRDQQHTELGGDGSDEYCHCAGDIHVASSKRLHEHEPNGDDNLHSDSNQCQWVGHVYSYRYGKCFR